jgi:phosphopantetheinyl transferase
MTVPEPWVCRWPQVPELPPPGRPVIIVRAGANARQSRREESRIVLRRVLAAWSGQPEHVIRVRESPRGPVWEKSLGGYSISVSLSYCEHYAWIGLLRGGSLGLDAMRPVDFPELEHVARMYLGLSGWTQIEQSSDRALAFAVAWTGLEARAKCLHQPIVELDQDGEHDSLVWGGAGRHWVVDGSVLSVVTA